jgi:DNA-binding NtrC family response regulator
LFESAALHSVVSLAVKVAAANVPVLITGPNGAGKEKIAEIVQANSPRRERPFIKVNAGALPDELFSAELFGSEAGAFTGARARREGRFELADGGTLFLDEIGNLSLESQAKLLRALQSGEFERLGSSKTLTADVRVIAATNVDLKRAIAEGRFREDLYYRLAVIEIEVPPLCDRRDDILPLATALIARHATASGTATPPALGSAAVAALEAYDWPGNVRELKNRLQRALLVAEGALLEPDHLGLGSSSTAAGSDRPGSAPAPPAARASRPGTLPPTPDDPPDPALADRDLSPLERAERDTIQRALGQADYVISRAAGALGLSRQALYRRMQRLGMKVRRDVG